jgi:hypothetical protein
VGRLGLLGWWSEGGGVVPNDGMDVVVMMVGCGVVEGVVMMDVLTAPTCPVCPQIRRFLFPGATGG